MHKYQIKVHGIIIRIGMQKIVSKYPKRKSFDSWIPCFPKFLSINYLYPSHVHLDMFSVFFFTTIQKQQSNQDFICWISYSHLLFLLINFVLSLIKIIPYLLNLLKVVENSNPYNSF
jgi:hypothetical protein